MVNLDDILKKSSRSMVGQILKQSEILEASCRSEEAREKLSLLKNFNRELIYQEFRNLAKELGMNSLRHEFKIYKAPTKS